MKPKINFTELINEIRSIGKRLRLKDDGAFIFWFINSHIVDREQIIKESLTGKEGGQGGEKNIDAIYIDYKAEQVNIIQGKFHTTEGKREKRNDVLSFTELAYKVGEKKSTLGKFLHELDPIVKRKFEEAVKIIKEKKFKLNLFYVTTGECSKTILDEAKEKIRYAPVNAEVFIKTYNQVMSLYRRYVEDIVPSIPDMTLTIASEGPIQHNGFIRRMDPEKKIESWVLTVSGHDIGRMYEIAGRKIFAKNIRGYLGENTDINKSMKYTIEKEPHNFWYFNNGVTVVCDDVRGEMKGIGDKLIIEGAQIINGQQTTIMLNSTNSKRTNIIVKIIKVPREFENNGEYDNLINSIVRATNWQNVIKQSDLVSNDYIQVYLEREFRKAGYQYIRKRMSKREARIEFGQGYHQFKKDELAQAVAATIFDPVVVRKGKEGLFEDPYYNSIFRSHEIHFYLSRYWMMKKVQLAAKGYPQRAYAKWLVLNFLWKELGHQIDSKISEKKFRVACETKNEKILNSLHYTIVSVYRAAIRFYNLNKGEGEEAKDESTFFQGSKLHEQFEKFWTTSRNKYREKYNKSSRRLLALLKNFEYE